MVVVNKMWLVLKLHPFFYFQLFFHLSSPNSILLSIQPLHSSYAKPHPLHFHRRQLIGSSAARWNVCRHASVCMRAGKKGKKKLLLVFYWELKLCWRLSRCNPLSPAVCQRELRSAKPPPPQKAKSSQTLTLSSQLSDMIPALYFHHFYQKFH